MGETAGAIRVLHVDDEPDFADMAATFLEREDDRFDVETETSASDGLDRLSETEFDCVITDYDMPGQNGIEFLEAVREDYPDLPVILFTGKGSEEVASDAISAGVTDYLQKGSGTDQYTVLVNRVQNAVERREAEQERSRQLEAIETAQEGISILDDDGHYIYVNQRFADLHGYDPEELVGRHWQLVYQDEDIPEVREEILPEVERAGYWHGETTSLRADGKTVDVDHTLSMTDRGELICTVRDISDRKERERELREKTARLEALFENSPDMINVHDTDGNIIDPNPQLCDELGYEAAELTGMKVWDVDRAIDPEAARTLWEDMEVGDSHRLEGRYRRHDGSTFPVEVHIRRLQLDGEDRFIAISRDISGRRERQAELQRYEHIVENLPVGVFRTTPDGEFIDTNEQYAALLGVDSPADLADLEAGDFWADPEDRELLLRELEQEGVVEGREVEVQTLAGDSKLVETTLRITEHNGDRYLDGVVRDITERRERRRRLEQAETLIENAQDALFLVDVSGEFTIERVNPAYERATGLSNEALSGRRPRDVFGDEQGADIERRFRDCVEQRGTLEYEETLSIDGEQTYWETRIAPVVMDGEVGKIVGATRDITDRKERERKLELVETLFEHTEECQFIVDAADGTFELRHANDYYRRTVGLSPDEPAGGRTPAELFGESRGQEIIDRYTECVETRESVTYTVELPVPEAGTVYQTILTPVVTDEEVRYIVGTARDVTDQRRRERELERYERLIETLPIGYVRTSFDDEFLDMNSTFVDMLGGDSKDEIRSQNVSEFYRDPTTREQLLARIHEEGKVEGEELKVTTLNGDTIWIAVTGRLIDEEEPYVDALVQDITEQKEYEQEIREERAFVEQCLDALDDVFYVFGPDSEILRWNDRLSEVTGYSDEEIAEMGPADFFPEEHAPRIAQAVEDVLETGRTTVQADYLTKDGERIPHEFTGFRLTDPEGETLGFAGIGRNLSQRREYERQLERRNERLEEFASIVSHDLRNPLNVASGRLELAREECESPHLDAVAEAHTRIEELIGELLTLAREGTVAIDPEAVSLADLTRASWQTVATEEATLSIDGGVTVQADESRLRQLLENLFRNAVEHGDTGVTVSVGPLDGEGFYVADDGPGIPEAERASVFESGVTTDEDGIGAGLSIVERVADAHGWDVTVTDSDSGGARFEITGVECSVE